MIDLAAELSRITSIRRILWWHLTDRWYFGDFLRHTPWLPWLAAAFPDAVLDVATHPDYLPLIADGGFGDLRDARSIDATTLSSTYDLVVIPGAFERALVRVESGLSLATWDAGWAVRRDGRVLLGGTKAHINYFRAAHPGSICRSPAGEVGLRTAPGARALVETAQALDFAFAAGQPVVVYNPTSSNPFTRETDLPKEVDNTLTGAEHAVVLRQLAAILPDHAFVVGAATKPDDHANTAVAQEVLGRCRDLPVALLAELPLPGGQSLRGFADLLGSPRVCSVVGGGTGTNTHLAALTATFGFSIEHGSDPVMIDNWRRPQEFQMGSFRWRNPSPLAGSHTLDWSRRTPRALAAAAEAFGCHHLVGHGAWERLFADPAAALDLADAFAGQWRGQEPTALALAAHFLDVMTPTARTHYGDFTDEAAFLRLKYGIGRPTDGLAALQAAVAVPSASKLAVGLFEHSNLHKLLGTVSKQTQLGRPVESPQGGIPSRPGDTR